MTEPRPAYRWPWFVWGAFVVAFVLVGLAVLREARRVYQMKLERIESGYLPNPTNPVSIPSTNPAR